MARSTLLARVYFALALLGLVWSWFYFIEFFVAVEGFHLQSFFSSVMINAASSGVAIDAMIAGVVFSVMVITSAARDGVKWPWLYVLLTFLVGLCFAIPLYFGFRERAFAPDIP